MKSSLMRKTTMRYVAGATAMAASLSLVACGGGGEKASGDFDGEVKVGILHSRSGTMAISENTVAEAELMAIEEINASGGVLGRRRLALAGLGHFLAFFRSLSLFRWGEVQQALVYVFSFLNYLSFPFGTAGERDRGRGRESLL